MGVTANGKRREGRREKSEEKNVKLNENDDKREKIL